MPRWHHDDFRFSVTVDSAHLIFNSQEAISTSWELASNFERFSCCGAVNDIQFSRHMLEIHGSCYIDEISWWRHQMETFSALLAICAVPGEFPAQRPVTRTFDVSFDLRLNKRLSKRSWGWWFETPTCPLWCHCNVFPSVKDDILNSSYHKSWIFLSYTMLWSFWTKNISQSWIYSFDILFFVQHIESETKWSTFCRRHFRRQYIEWKCASFD